MCLCMWGTGLVAWQSSWCSTEDGPIGMHITFDSIMQIKQPTLALIYEKSKSISGPKIRHIYVVAKTFLKGFNFSGCRSDQN